jgi:hypothetical protein
VRGAIQNGMMRISSASLAGPTKKAEGSGLLDLRTEEIKILFDISLAPALASRSSQAPVRAVAGLAGGKQKNALVKIPVPLAMVGRIRNPEFVFSADSGVGRQGGRVQAGGD